jgi:hypothetical protein
MRHEGTELLQIQNLGYDEEVINESRDQILLLNYEGEATFR